MNMFFYMCNIMRRKVSAFARRSWPKIKSTLEKLPQDVSLPPTAASMLPFPMMQMPFFPMMPLMNVQLPTMPHWKGNVQYNRNRPMPSHKVPFQKKKVNNN